MPVKKVISMRHCAAKGCRFADMHKTIYHRCGKCGKDGHGQYECESPHHREAMTKLDSSIAWSTDSNALYCSICKADSHCTAGHRCFLAPHCDRHGVHATPSHAVSGDGEKRLPLPVKKVMVGTAAMTAAPAPAHAKSVAARVLDEYDKFKAAQARSAETAKAAAAQAKSAAAAAAAEPKPAATCNKCDEALLKGDTSLERVESLRAQQAVLQSNDCDDCGSNPGVVFIEPCRHVCVCVDCWLTR